MTRSMSMAAIALAILVLAGEQAQAQSEFKEKTGKPLADSKKVGSSAGQEKELDSQGTGAEHEFHRNHFGGFLGASTHSDNHETGITLGLEYARQFTPRWAVTAITELATGDLERETIVAVGVVFYPMRRLAFVVAQGVELADKGVERDGELEKEHETGFLLRLGASHTFPVGQAGLGPVVSADWAANRWTLVYGIGIVTGF